MNERAIYQRCQAAEAELINDWKTLVNIDSPTGYGEGLTRVGTIVAEKLKSFRAEVEIHPISKDAGFNVVGTLKGKGKGSILLLVHMDTVLPVGSASQRPFRIDSGGKAYGPGVSDDKSGVVQCLHSMKLLQEIGFTDYAKVTLFANCQEENGSRHSRELIMRLAKEHDHVLCAEPGALGDGVTVNRAGSGSLITEVKGLTAHAAYPWQGRNAADELAHQVLQLNKLADKEKGTVVTTRIIESGLANTEKMVVPDHARAVMRVYAYTPEEIDRVQNAAVELTGVKYIPGTEVTSAFTLHFPPFVKSEAATKLAGLAQSIYAELGLSLKTVSSAAAADVGWAYKVNSSVLCSLGPVTGGQNHTDKEWADARSVVPRLYLMTAMLMELGSHGVEGREEVE